MHFPLSLFLVAVTGVTVIALPVANMGLDPQAAVEQKLEVRQAEVSLWFQIVSFRGVTGLLIDELSWK